jgi:hypothetical protein
MGMLLSLPMILAGCVLVFNALRQPRMGSAGPMPS